MTFSTLTFNMQNGQPWTDDDALDIELDRTIEFLRGQAADVIFLQEVERGFDGGRQIEPPPHYTRLRECLAGYDSVFAYPAPNGHEIPFGLGLAIFCKSELRDFQKTDLPAPDIAFEFAGRQRKPSQRLLISAAADIGGRTVSLLNTHLQAFFMIGATSVDHPAQRAAVERALREVRGPAILAGDLNNAPGEGVVEQFAGAGFQAVQDKEPTWKRKPFAIDHLLYNSPLRLVNHAVIPTACSDHHALRAEFAFAG